MLPLVVFFKKFHQKVTQTIFTNEIKAIVAVPFKNGDLFPAGEQRFFWSDKENTTSHIFTSNGIAQNGCYYGDPVRNHFFGGS